MGHMLGIRASILGESFLAGLLSCGERAGAPYWGP